MNKPFKKLSYIERRKKLQSNIKYYFVGNFISDDVRVINKKEFKNGSWIEYKQLEVKDFYTNKIYQYNFSCKYKLGDIIQGINKRFIHCLYVSKYKVKVLDITA